uniref:Uncharacterized protein n=1 Tax=Sipha flava TaxID=143950 RepID=A0A2S2QNI9_9HEMI
MLRRKKKKNDQNVGGKSNLKGSQGDLRMKHVRHALFIDVLDFTHFQPPPGTFSRSRFVRAYRLVRQRRRRRRSRGRSGHGIGGGAVRSRRPRKRLCDAVVIELRRNTTPPAARRPLDALLLFRRLACL